jgi:hypothetical protein
MPRTLVLLDQVFDYDAILGQGPGRHLIKDDLAGARVHAEVADGRIMGLHVEADESVVDAFFIRDLGAETDKAGRPRPGLRPVKCYFCACAEAGCYCMEVPCDYGG